MSTKTCILSRRWTDTEVTLGNMQPVNTWNMILFISFNHAWRGVCYQVSGLWLPVCVPAFWVQYTETSEYSVVNFMA